MYLMKNIINDKHQTASCFGTAVPYLGGAVDAVWQEL